jgi:hypothetical protein
MCAGRPAAGEDRVAADPPTRRGSIAWCAALLSRAEAPRRTVTSSAAADQGGAQHLRTLKGLPSLSCSRTGQLPMLLFEGFQQRIGGGHWWSLVFTGKFFEVGSFKRGVLILSPPPG